MYTIDELIASGERPRVHGNGFLQLDLPGGSRLHVWDDRLPRQAVSTQIHDHSFTLSSTVLKGRLRHTVISDAALAGPANSYGVYVAEPTPGREHDTTLVPERGRGAPRVVGVEVVTSVEMAAGSSYTFSPYVLHTTDAEGTTATLMRKLTRDAGYRPRVLVPLGQEPDNEFDREQQDEFLLWEVVRDALEGELVFA